MTPQEILQGLDSQAVRPHTARADRTLAEEAAHLIRELLGESGAADKLDDFTIPLPLADETEVDEDETDSAGA